MKLSLLPWLAVLLLPLVVSVRAAIPTPSTTAPWTVDELRAGMKGEVWTVFEGTEPEPFSVEVSGVIRNALGPGKAMILCRLTDPRVQAMGAVAGMSGSPLYIEGRLAGALSYQVQRFETVRYAGFTPAADLAEVAQKLSATPLTPMPMNQGEKIARVSTLADGVQPLTPVFSVAGLSPAVAELFSDQFRAMGLATSVLGGYTSGSGASSDAAREPGSGSDDEITSLRPGEAVAVALALGDITIAGTGTVSLVDGNRITAFGHPMLGLGEVALPLCSAEIVAILPSNLSSFKVSNTGPVIGTLLQDRLSAVAGELGSGPPMIPVEVQTPQRTLRFSTLRHAQLAPMITAAGVSQAVLGSNDAGLTEGFRISTRIVYSGLEPIETDLLYAGPQGFAAGMAEFLQRLNASLQNPFEKTFPERVSIKVDPLPARPWAYLDQVYPSATRVRPGETLSIDLVGRDHQGDALKSRVEIAVPESWIGQSLELVIMNGRDLDQATGQASTLTATDVRSFATYLEALRTNRRPDGLYIAVVEKASALIDQNARVIEMPGSIDRITRGSPNSRYARQDLSVPLWETRVFPDRLINASVRRTFSVVE